MACQAAFRRLTSSLAEIDDVSAPEGAPMPRTASGGVPSLEIGARVHMAEEVFREQVSHLRGRPASDPVRVQCGAACACSYDSSASLLCAVLHLLCAWQAFGIDAEVHSAGDWGPAIAKVREVDVNASPRDNAAALVRVARNKGTLITLYVTTNMCWPCIVQVQATTALSTVYASGRAARGNTGPAALAGAELMPLYQYILIQVRSRRVCVCGLLVYLTEAISRAWLGAGRATEPGVGPGPGGVRGWNACPFWHD